MSPATKRSEADVGRACDELALACGYIVERYEQRRATNITCGLPDRRYVKRGVRLWVELKAPGGKMTERQCGWLMSEIEAGGLATVIDDEQTLRALFSQLARRSAIVEGVVRDQCRELILLCSMRGFRREAA